MDLLPNADQRALITATRQFIDSRFPLQAHGTVGIDALRWKEIAELGWFALALPEDVGGFGATLLEETLVFREIGRGLIPGYPLATLGAARLACLTGNNGLAGELISGQLRVARAITPGGSGAPVMVLGPEGCDLLLLTTAETAVLWRIPAEMTLNPGLEDGSTVAYVDSTELHDAVLASTDPTVVSRLSLVMCALTAAQLAGIAARTAELATEHARTRIQFGRPIGAFQAIKHRCADLAINAYAAQHLTVMAALSGSHYDVLAAAAFCRPAAFENARANVQIRGAMGFTAEDTAHRFLKRTHTLCCAEDVGTAANRLAQLPSATEPVSEQQ